MTKKIATMIQTVFLTMFIQGCSAADIKESNEKAIETSESNLTENSTKPSYVFDKFYADDIDMSKLGYSETDKQVCHSLPKVLNAIDAGPMICMVKFPKDGPFENVEWSEIGKDKSLLMEKLRMGRTQKTWCGIGSTDSKIHEKTANSIDSGKIIYQSTAADIDNDGKEDSLLRKVWTENYCDIDKEQITPRAVRLIYACRNEGSQPVDLKEIHSLDVFKYKGKYYLYSWHGTKSQKGFININEYVANESKALDGIFVSHWVRQLCRINYQ